MADYDVLDMAVMLRDAQRSLRSLFPDYEEKAEPCRQVLRRMMADIPTDKVLVALTHALAGRSGCQRRRAWRQAGDSGAEPLADGSGKGLA